MIKGVDISVYNGVIDFNALKASGIDFVGIRLLDTSGVNVDSAFKSNWIEAKQAGLLRYWYIPHYPWLDQSAVVKTMFNIMNEFDRGDWNFLMGELPPAVDVEVQYVFNSQEFMWNQLQLMIKQIKTVMLAKPLIYTSANVWDNYYNKGNVFKFIDEVPDLWVSNYVYDYQKVGKMVTTWDKLLPFIDTFKPAIPNTWQGIGYKIWQIAGDDGTNEGASSPIDLNIWRGSYEELVKWSQDHKIKEVDAVPGEQGTPSRFSKVNELFWKGDIGGAVNALFNLPAEVEVPKDVKPLPSNQEVINAFFNAYGGETYYDKMIEKLGISKVNEMIANRGAIFLVIDSLPQEVKEML